MDRRQLMQGIGAAGLAALIPGLLRGEEKKEESLTERCKDYKKYVPKPEIKAKYDALEQRYNKECHEGKNCEQIISELGNIVKQDPNWAEPYHSIGTAFIETGQYDKAIPYLEKAVQLDPCNPLFYRNLGNTRAMIGMKNKDKETIRVAVSEIKKVCEVGENSEWCKKAKTAINNLTKTYLKE